MSEDITQPRRQSEDSRPIPDPTILTTEALHREISQLRTLLNDRIDSNAKIRTVELKRIDLQFKLIERQRREQKLDTKLAVDAALNAAKEAVKEQTTASGNAIAKSESSTADQLKQMAENFKTATGGLETRLSDLKDRIIRMETSRIDIREGHIENRANTGQLLAVIVAAVSTAGLALSIILSVGFHR